jgi:hypothetical protein
VLLFGGFLVIGLPGALDLLREEERERETLTRLLFAGVFSLLDGGPGTTAASLAPAVADADLTDPLVGHGLLVLLRSRSGIEAVENLLADDIRERQIDGRGQACLVDAWGTPIRLRHVGDSLELRSAGRARRLDTPDDVVAVTRASHVSASWTWPDEMWVREADFPEYYAWDDPRDAPAGDPVPGIRPGMGFDLDFMVFERTSGQTAAGEPAPTEESPTAAGYRVSATQVVRGDETWSRIDLVK